ncbi:hypothetical protein [Palleronia pelagia]|uniref:MSP1 EGF domain 1 n=1 Tax=Palleronia pelagia TaxID=387096 RepID=A0A1H8ML72_9RHOB|nr:hypothetical protein [Palleronia pelagia]SEO18067.1 hypothetical protein SAMN04488011_1219 [Palleronia pelagia]
MTDSTRPTLPHAPPIEVAENEGMPPGPNFIGFSPPFAQTRQVTGTLTLALSRTRTATDGLRSAKEKLMRHPEEAPKHPLARLIARMAVVAGMIASLAFPVLAQDGTGPMPENAEARSYGGGWNCALGYRVAGEECVTIDIPEHAYATGRSYGSGWACRRGYEEAGGTSCAAISVPDNAFLRSSGYEWQCDRGYRRDREACVPIVLPDNAYLTDDTSGFGWTCDRGFTASASDCVPIAIPENGYLTHADYGDEWACERGFFEIDGRCDPVALPANAFLDPASYGPGWRCERGFETVDTICVAIDLPVNAHLDRSGNSWRCDRGFQLAGGECVLGR